MRFKLVTLIVLIPLFVLQTMGQTAKGGEIQLERQGLFLFEVTVRLIINWPATVNKPYVHINWGDRNPIDSIPYVGSSCTYSGSSVLNYIGYHTFPSNGNYTLTVQDDFLVGGITNIPNSTTQKLVLKHILTTTIFNSPPVFLLCLNDSVYCGADNFYYSSGTIEDDGDSISFSIADHPEFAGYTLAPVTVDGMSGLLSFTANTTGRYNISLKVDEWRKPTSSSPRQIIGSSYREMFVSVCDILAGLNSQLLLDQVKIYPNPTTSKLKIDIGTNDIQSVVVFDLLGTELFHQKGPVSEIDLSDLPSGLYFLNVEVGASKNVFKIIKE
jgi:hypothetical protein